MNSTSGVISCSSNYAVIICAIKKKSVHTNVCAFTDPIDFEVLEGNPGAIALYFHGAQVCSTAQWLISDYSSHKIMLAITRSGARILFSHQFNRF